MPVDDRARLGGVPFLHPLETPLLGGRESLALDGVNVEDDRSAGLQRLAKRASQHPHVVAVDHAHVREVELLEQQTRRPVGLDRRLDLGTEALDPLAEAQRELREPLLDSLARLVQPRIQAHALEVARQRPDVG
jgi:hypothetical protein